jgi:predicted DCC family thiol-disulfide oxidoreductase YuxK
MTRLQVFYDGGCPLCRKEIAYYRRIDRGGCIDWIDITTADAVLTAAGLDRVTAMRRLHVREPHGAVVSGAAAFLAIWRRLPGWRRLAHAAELLRLTGLLEWGYVRFADRRFRRRCADGACPAVPEGRR